MFRTMRRTKKEISLIEAKQILKEARYGIFSVMGDDDYPYAIPVNFYYDEDSNKIIFHGAKEGHKVDSLKRNDKVCFTVVGKEEIKNEDWAPYTKSVVVFGKCHMLFDENIEQVRTLANKFYPTKDEVEEEIKHAGQNVAIYIIDIEHISGKSIQEK